jgi:hypothetical protein
LWRLEREGWIREREFGEEGGVALPKGLSCQHAKGRAILVRLSSPALEQENGHIPASLSLAFPKRMASPEHVWELRRARKIHLVTRDSESDHFGQGERKLASVTELAGTAVGGK